ncbi:MAG TPA: glycine betaine ABC transporter substrate-binding protein [Bacteroidales bacterium]|nr:glycine betaine ABC transporter substrate-binding protein [Bacteroidales bacterium]
MGLLLILPFYSCNFSKTSQDEEERIVRLNYTDWTESVAITMLASTVLEEKMGYQVELKLTDIESVYDELAAGQADFFADAWLPRTHHQYFNKHEAAIDTVGAVFKNPKTGLVVPRYSQLHSIPDLKENQIPILGIDEGAGIMTNTKEAIAHYQLDNELLTLSDDQMTFQMVDSIKRRKEVVVTGWEPHWMFNRHKVRFLEDPDNVFPTNEHIYSIGNKRSMKEHPNATEFFRRMQLTDEQFNSLIDQVKMATDPVNGIHQWMHKHQYIVNKWIKDLQPERLKVM